MFQIGQSREYYLVQTARSGHKRLSMEISLNSMAHPCKENPKTLTLHYTKNNINLNNCEEMLIFKAVLVISWCSIDKMQSCIHNCTTM